MKQKITFMYCEYCNRAWESVSPPTTEEYQNGLIDITNGSVLLPDPIVSEDCHSKDISGIYCDHKCLNGHIKKILKEEI